MGKMFYVTSLGCGLRSQTGLEIIYNVKEKTHGENELEVCGVLDSISVIPIPLIYSLLSSILVSSSVDITCTPSWFLPSVTKLCATRLIVHLIYVIYWKIHIVNDFSLHCI